MMRGRRFAQLGLFAGLVGVEVWLARDLSGNAGLPGYVMTESFSISAPERSQIKSIEVKAGAVVNAGDIVVRLDTALVDAELANISARKVKAHAAIAAARNQRRLEIANFERRFDANRDQANATWATAEAAAATASAELAALDFAIAEQSKLVAEKLATAAQLNALKLQRATVEKKATSAKGVVAVLRKNVASSQRGVGIAEDDEDLALAPLKAEVEALAIAEQQLERRRESFTLRAPVAGVVGQVVLNPGDYAQPQSSITTIVTTDTKRVVTCIPESYTQPVEPGVEVDMHSVVGSTSSSGVVETITRDIAVLPTRCQNPLTKIVALGRVAVVSLDTAWQGLPGQSQRVTISGRKRPGWVASRPDAVGQTPPPKVTAPRTLGTELRVPPELAKITRFEPSGLVWFPPLQRYLVVSDDTGLSNENEHAPWVFAVSSKGAVDAQPIAVTGVAELNDVESLTIAGDGSVWLLSSQSLSKKGKRPQSRQWLLRTTWDGKSFVVTHKVALFDAIVAASNKSPALAKALGVSASTELDIEGMAFRGGELFFGLKSPRGQSGLSLWSSKSPLELFTAVDKAGLTAVTLPNLEISKDGKVHDAGIADLLSFDDKTWLVAVTPSAPTDDTVTGAVYAVTGDSAVLIAAFPNDKPEGIARTESGAEIVVVFDRGANPGAWVTLSARDVATKVSGAK